MGILIRQADKKWLVELKETWYFRSDTDAFEKFKRFAIKYHVGFAPAMTVVNKHWSVELRNERIVFSSPRGVLLAVKEALLFKEHHGDPSFLTKKPKKVVKK